MGDITTIGLDLAKNVFQVHAVDKTGNVVVRTRNGSCLGRRHYLYSAVGSFFGDHDRDEEL